MSDEMHEKVDLEELRRLNLRAIRRLRAFVAKFKAMEAWERNLAGSRKSTDCASDQGNSTEAGETEGDAKKENGSK